MKKMIAIISLLLSADAASAQPVDLGAVVAAAQAAAGACKVAGIDGLPNIKATWVLKFEGGCAANSMTAANASAQAYVQPASPMTVPTGVFVSRLTDAELSALSAAAGNNAALLRWFETAKISGTINLSGGGTNAVKAGLVTAGVLSQARADVIFSP